LSAKKRFFIDREARQYILALGDELKKAKL